LTDAGLRDAIREMRQGLIDADQGGGLVKKRIGIAGRGKRGGARTLVAMGRHSCWFFVFGFAKNERANISNAELEALRFLAGNLMSHTPAQIRLAMVLNTSVSTVRKWEQGDKQPSGPSLKLLNLLDRKGLEAVL